MNKKSIIECEIKSIEKLKRFQLTHKFKKIGMGIFLVSVLSFIIYNSFMDNSFIKHTARYGVIVGLLLMSISKEKIEDELIRDLRMQSYMIAFIGTVFIILFRPLFSLLVNPILAKQKDVFRGMGDWNVLLILIGIQLLYFEILKRFHK